MNDSNIDITLDLDEDDMAVTPPEMQLVADLLPELLKELLWLQEHNEA